MSPATKRNARGEKVDNSTKSSDYSKYYDSRVLSDVTIRYSGRVFHGHKVVLANGAAWFAIAFQNEYWLESTAKEITLMDDDPDALEGMFKHMYNINPQPFEEHDSEVSAKEATPDQVLYCIELFRVADKYNCASLLEAAPNMFHHEFGKTTHQMTDYVFDSHGIHGHDSFSHERRIDWKKRCAVPAETLREIAEAVYELQNSWSQEGRSPITSDFVTQFFSYHEISPISQGVCIEAVMKVAKEVPELGRDLFVEIMDRRGNIRWLE